MEKPPKKLVLVDGSSYLFRAYHALPPLTNSKGIPTGAVYGVINMLKKLLNDEKPDYIAVIFDTKSKNFRHELYPEYKANRSEMPEELQVQIQPLHQIIEAMGLPLLAIEGIEADDLIGALANEACQQKLKTVISTGDKDMAQLVNEDVTLVNTMTATVLDEKNVMQKFGVKPSQIVDYLALIGDNVDNVPGIPKVGPKTAAKWLNEYQTLENIIENADKISGKIGENLRAHVAQLPLAKQLVTIRCDLGNLPKPQTLQIKAAQNDRLQQLFEQLEFKAWLKELTQTHEARASSLDLVKGSYETVSTQEVLNRWCDQIKQAQYFVIDTETTSVNPFQAQLVGISLAIKAQQAIYIPLAHQNPSQPQLAKDWVLQQLAPLLSDQRISKIGQNIKYDMHVLAQEGVHLKGLIHDTMLASYVLNSVMRHDMDSLALHYLNHQTITYEEVAGKGAKQIGFDEVAMDKATQYAAEDADVTYQLHNVLQERLAQTPALKKVYDEIEIPLIPVLWQMEQHGICLDVALLDQQSQELGKAILHCEEQAAILAGESFNLASPKQLQAIFYDKLGWPILERTPKGAPSTAESVLHELSHDYALAKVILEHRTLSKLKSTYTDKLPQMLNPKTKRIHTSYNQAVTATGRLSSTEPNLQNIPIRTHEGRKIRQAFVADKNCVLVAADYSQIELRIMAHLSQDKGLLEAFSNGQDIHRFTASEIFDTTLDKVTADQRRKAKAINFGLIYGMSAFGLAKQLETDRAHAQQYIDKYFERYPGVKHYMDSIRAQAYDQGYVSTIFGRRLYLPEIRAKQIPRKRAAERTAINAPMQGSAADLIKKAMIMLHPVCQQQGYKMLLQVHDELVFEVVDHQVDEAKKTITHHMEHAAELSVPLEVSIGVGANWDEAHSL